MRSCLNASKIKRGVEGDGLSFYLAGLAKCISSVGRPRFVFLMGKRTYVKNISFRFGKRTFKG